MTNNVYIGEDPFDHQTQWWKKEQKGEMNSLDVRQQLFAITSEECGELIQVCMKILRKAKVNKEWNKKLLEEAGDVFCMLDLMVQHGYLNWDDIQKRSNIKKQKLIKWSDLISDDNK